MISSPVQALVVFDAHTDVDFVRAALPANTASQAIPMSHGVERVLAAFDDIAADLLIVGSAEASHGALDLIAETRRRHENAVIVALQDQCDRVGLDFIHLLKSVPGHGLHRKLKRVRTITVQ